MSTVGVEVVEQEMVGGRRRLMVMVVKRRSCRGEELVVVRGLRTREHFHGREGEGEPVAISRSHFETLLVCKSITKAQKQL